MVGAGFSKSSSQSHDAYSNWRVIYTRDFRSPYHMTCIEQLTHDIEDFHLPSLITVIDLLSFNVDRQSEFLELTTVLASIVCCSD